VRCGTEVKDVAPSSVACTEALVRGEPLLGRLLSPLHARTEVLHVHMIVI
jgi:hypothetical protein